MTERQREFFSKVKALCKEYDAMIDENELDSGEEGVHTVTVTFKFQEGYFYRVHFDLGFAQDEWGKIFTF